MRSDAGAIRKVSPAAKATLALFRRRLCKKKLMWPVQIIARSGKPKCGAKKKP